MAAANSRQNFLHLATPTSVQSPVSSTLTEITHTHTHTQTHSSTQLHTDVHTLAHISVYTIVMYTQLRYSTTHRRAHISAYTIEMHTEAQPTFTKKGFHLFDFCHRRAHIHTTIRLHLHDAHVGTHTTFPKEGGVLARVRPPTPAASVAFSACPVACECCDCLAKPAESTDSPVEAGFGETRRRECTQSAGPRGRASATEKVVYRLNLFGGPSWVLKPASSDQKWPNPNGSSHYDIHTHAHTHKFIYLSSSPVGRRVKGSR
ncbi:unnamed protein product [Protopolystoma xenopodis]|uniref:Uncharacterized protein n=1 Tax=Protopolystoma xenopodis TaxID=117903 RepID=A0A3S5AVQ9_9PLAT|nr:unnamed protein product [Protopolystoma xenopodis]